MVPNRTSCPNLGPLRSGEDFHIWIFDFHLGSQYNAHKAEYWLELIIFLDPLEPQPRNRNRQILSDQGSIFTDGISTTDVSTLNYWVELIIF